MFPRLRTLVVKEIQTLLRGKQSRALLIVPVVLQLVLFPNAATMEVRNNTLAILNQDGGQPSRDLIQRLSHTEAFPHLLMLHDEAALRRCIDDRKALMAVRVPADFSRDIREGRTAPIQVILDGRRSNSGQIALTYVTEIVENYAAGLHPDRAAPSITVTRHWFNPNLDYRWFIIPSLVAIITTVSSLVVTALSVAREREEGTFDQLLVSPYTPGMIMFGKAVPAFLVSAVQATIILTAGVFVYGIPFQGNLLLLYGSMLCYIAALVGFGLFISALCSTQQQAFLGSFSFMVPAILLSGFVAPVENMPTWLQILTWLDPLRHFIVIVKGLFLKDIGVSIVLERTWPLLVIAFVTLTAASIVFRRRLG